MDWEPRTGAHGQYSTHFRPAHTVAIYRNKTAANARRFLRDLERACPIRIRTILTDNVLYAELLAGLASGHYRIEVSRHVHSMAQFGFLVNDSLSHNKHRVRFCGSHRP